MAELSSFNRPSRASTPSAREIAAVLFRQKRTLLLTFTSVFLIVIIYGLLTPSYRAEMKFLVRKERVDPVVSPTPSQPLLLQTSAVSDEELNSEVQLLKDNDTLDRVVRQAGLAAAPRWWFSGKQDDDVRIARAVRTLARRLSVEPVRKTALIAVNYASSDPVQAARVLQCLASVYLEKNQQLQRPVGQSVFFEQQMKASSAALVDAETQLGDFGDAQKVVSAALQRDLTLQKLSEAEASRKQLQVSIAETQERIRSLQNKIPSLPERSVSQVRAADNPLLLQVMKQKLLDLELRRTELLTKFAPSYRLVQEVEQQIAETKAAIDSELAAPIRDETTEKDPTFEWSKSELMKAQVELSGLRARAAAADQVLASYGDAAFRLGRATIGQEDLLRNLKAAEDKFLLYAGKREEARIGDALDQQGILNVVIAQPPAVPALPAQPVWKFAAIGLIAAIAVSVSAAFVLDYLDPSFRTPEEVVIHLRMPVLASYPRKVKCA